MYGRSVAIGRNVNRSYGSCSGRFIGEALPPSLKTGPGKITNWSFLLWDASPTDPAGLQRLYVYSEGASGLFKWEMLIRMAVSRLFPHRVPGPDMIVALMIRGYYSIPVSRPLSSTGRSSTRVQLHPTCFNVLLLYI
jgi:hypothetical protein